MEIFVAVSIIIAYCLGMWLIGILAGKRGQPTIEDYFLASRSLGYLVLSTGMLATWASAFAFLGNVGMYYTHGLAYVIQIPFNLIVIHLFYKFGVRTWKLGKHFNFTTPGDIFENFYESRAVGFIISSILVIFTIPFISIQLMSAGYMFEIASKGTIPFWAGALILCATVAFYSWSGGKRATMWTNVAQCALMLGGLILAGYSIVSEFGGIRAIFENVARHEPALLTVPGPLGTWHYRQWISYTVAIVLGSICGPHMIVNMMVGRNPKVLKQSMPIMAIPAFMAVPVLLMAFAGRIGFPGLKGADADYVLPLLLTKLFPLWFAALVMAGGMAAAMSTIDQLVLASSGMITQNIYPKSLKYSSPERQLNHSRIWVLILCFIAYLIAITRPSLISVMGIWVNGCWMQIATVFFGVLYWQRATKEGAICGVLTGVLINILFTVLPPPFKNPFGFTAAFWAILANIAVFYLVSKFTVPPSKEKCEMFRDVMLTN